MERIFRIIGTVKRKRRVNLYTIAELVFGQFGTRQAECGLRVFIPTCLSLTKPFLLLQQIHLLNCSINRFMNWLTTKKDSLIISLFRNEWFCGQNAFGA